jgi:amidase
MATETSQPSHPTSDWQELVARKRRECQDKIPREWTLSEDVLKEVPQHLLEYDLPRRSGLLSNAELDITENYTATELLIKLASGQVSSLVVTTAFSKRAAIAQQVVSTIFNEYILLIMCHLIRITFGL